MNLAAQTFADGVLIATKTSKCNVRQGDYQGAGGRARKLLQNRNFFPVAQEPHLGLGHILVEVRRSHTVRHNTRGRTPLDEGSARRRARYLTTHNVPDRHPCRRWVSNPQSQQQGGLTTTANFRIKIPAIFRGIFGNVCCILNVYVFVQQFLAGPQTIFQRTLVGKHLSRRQMKKNCYL